MNKFTSLRATFPLHLHRRLVDHQDNAIHGHLSRGGGGRDHDHVRDRVRGHGRVHPHRTSMTLVIQARHQHPTSHWHPTKA